MSSLRSLADALERESNVIEPTVGRIVWFRMRAGDSPMAAIIVHVHYERRVNLTVFGPLGLAVPKTDVQLLQDSDQAPAHGTYCEWMPWQKGQAAKTEQLETREQIERRVDAEEQARGI